VKRKDAPRPYAELVGVKVKRVILAPSKEWCEHYLGGVWMDTRGYTLPSPRWWYDENVDDFRPQSDELGGNRE
jgi:hypothetical protein